ncbi:MAG: Lrp/AsnC family transcriptional regulator [Candidatus Methanofastidiosia archaeon]
MDRLDLRILKLLSEDSRVKTTKLSRILKKPNSTIDFRIKRMVREGIIERFTVLLNQKRIKPHSLALCEVKVEKPFFEENFREVLENVGEKLSKHKEVALLGTIGEGRIILILCCKDLMDLNTFVSEIIKKTPFIEAVNTKIFLEIYKSNLIY